MRYFDEDEAARLNAEPWQLALLKANPSYLGWGPHEDYMWKEGSGWDSRIVVPTCSPARSMWTTTRMPRARAGWPSLTVSSTAIRH